MKIGREHIARNFSHLLNIVLGAVLIGLVAVHLMWSYRASEINTVEAFQGEIYNGQPTIVIFYSNL